MKYKIAVLFVMLMTIMLADAVDELHADSPNIIPPWPIIYIGDATLNGSEITEEGLLVVGKMRDYVSIPLKLKDSRVAGLAVGGPDYSYFGEVITFELWRPTSVEGQYEVSVAAETDIFQNMIEPTVERGLSFTFSAFPTPTPVPTATPTVTPLPTATPLATATPISVGAVVYNGMVVVSGGDVPAGATLTARIGNYETNPVPVLGGQYISLIIDLDDPAFTNTEVKFYLNGIQSRTTAIYDVGDTIRNVDLIFIGIPDGPPKEEALQEPEVIVAAAAAPLVPTMEPSPTPVPTETPVANTPTPVVLVVTATPETPDPVEDEVVESDSGGCMSVKDVDPLTGTANVLAMLGPILLLVGYRGVRKIL